MSERYIGEIRMVAFNPAPTNWAFCNGALLQISQYGDLYTVIGTTYGGDGVNTFALPDLRSRAPIHMGTLAGNNYSIGQAAGEENVAVTSDQLPQHTHALSASSNTGTTGSPQGAVWASSSELPFSTNSPDAKMSPAAVGNTGSSQPHNNISPFLAVNFIIALNGVYPSRG